MLDHCGKVQGLGFSDLLYLNIALALLNGFFQNDIDIFKFCHLPMNEHYNFS